MKKEVEVKIIVCVVEARLMKKKANFFKDETFSQTKKIEWANFLSNAGEGMDLAHEFEIVFKNKCLHKLQDGFLSYFNVDDFLSLSNAVTIRKVKSWTEPLSELSETPLFELIFHCQSHNCRFDLEEVIKRYSLQFKNFTFHLY